MNRMQRQSSRCREGYLMTEVLVYLSVAFVLLGVAFLAMQRCIDASVLLRRNAHDIARAVHIGEVWRADIRQGAKGIDWREISGEKLLHIQAATNSIEYRLVNGTIERRVEPGSWGRVLDQVRSSSMQSDARSGVTAWSWELELEPTKRSGVQASRLRPLFTFAAVPAQNPSP